MVALAVVFIPMFMEEPNPEAVVTKSVDLPEPSTAVKAYRLSLTENSPPQPISPLVAAGKAPRHSGEIKRAAGPAVQAPSTATRPTATQSQPTPQTTRTVAVAIPPPAAESQPAAAESDEAAAESKAAAPTDPAASRPGWAVQVGSFANHDNAARLIAQLKDKGFHAFVTQHTHAGKTYYRVRVGPVAARREAEKLAPAVAAASGGPTKIVPNP